MLRKIMSVLGGVLLLCTFFISSGPVSAATAPVLSSASDFSNLEKTCAVIDVTLHGTQSPTMTCAQTMAQMGSTVSPLTQRVGCGTSSTIITMAIRNSTGGTVCFINHGYWGYTVTSATQVWSPNHTTGWFLFYLNSSSYGVYCGLGGAWPGAWSQTLPSPVLITQIYPGNSTYKNCV